MRLFGERFFLLGILAISLAGCLSPQVIQEDIAISVTADDETQQVSIAAGSTAQQALTAAGITLGSLDHTDLPLYAILTDGEAIRVIRVREDFITEQLAIPYEHQVVQNESLLEGETRLIQPGSNGLQELTYRRVYEDGVEKSNTVVKVITMQAAVPEIIMLGTQNPFAPLDIPGALAYLTGGNAWVMENSTANRRPLVTSGDLDGYVFTLSPDSEWLLFTRRSDQAAEEEINTLWVVNTTSQGAAVIDLKVSNVIHFAQWVPGQDNTITYSTVEPRAAAPGWQANNDLYSLKFDASGPTTEPAQIMEANAGGVYSWWGTAFSWSPDGSQLAYARPDGIGLVDTATGLLTPLLDITPLQTHSDWAWIPGLAWGADSRTLFTVTHAPTAGLVSAEESPFFDLSAVSLVNSANVRIVLQSGMFAQPAASSLQSGDAEHAYLVAYLQAIFPAQSETSRYHLVVMDRDGSNRRVLFPVEGLTGLEPQTPEWAPAVLGSGADFLAVIYQGNLWLVDTASGQAQQVTGDGLISRIDWK